MERHGLRLVGRGENGEVRVVELPDRQFFLATLFLPQHRSTAGEPHPIITAFLNAAVEAKHCACCSSNNTRNASPLQNALLPRQTKMTA
jgi:CTP synthase (UTP-ammonia lyase)